MTWAALALEALATVRTIAVLLSHDDTVDVARDLAKKVDLTLKPGLPDDEEIEALRALTSGIAAARANAVQEALRRKANTCPP